MFAMWNGVIFLWFLLTVLAVVFVALDIQGTPESPVLKWAFVLIAAYTGPFGAFLYVLGCREPLPGLHNRYVAIRWRQVLGSTMHCVAGDGVGILVGAAIGSALHLSALLHITLEYVLGFGFGWTVFQALFMRDMAGGSFGRSLHITFVPEFLSMNALMAGMIPVTSSLMAHIPGSDSPRHANFWFVMCIALLTGAVVAYPMNWWLVARHLKHGMMTVRRGEVKQRDGGGHGGHDFSEVSQTASTEQTETASHYAVTGMAVFSLMLFAVGIVFSRIWGTGR